MKIERKTFSAAEFKATDAVQGIAEMIVSVFGNIDGGNEIVMPGFFSESIASRRTPDGRPKAKGVWMHEWTIPIAKTLDARELYVGDPLLPPHLKDLGGLWVKAQFNLDTQRGREAFSDLQGGYIDEFSIGYGVTADKWEGGIRKLFKGDWYEWSPVLVGMNSETALVGTKAIDSKVAIPFKATAKAPEDEVWSKPALKDFTDKAWGDLTDAEIAKITACFTWAANNPPESFGDLLLPHHNPSGQVVWAGVAACAARMNQADIPSEDMAAVAKHIAGHYEQFDKNVPQSMMDMMGKGQTYIEQAETVLATVKELVERSKSLADLRSKEGRTLSSANREKLASLLEALASVSTEISDLLSATEPQKAVDLDYLKRRLRASAFLLASFS